MKYLILICCIIGALHTVCVAGDKTAIKGKKVKPPPSVEKASPQDDASIVWKKPLMGSVKGQKDGSPQYDVYLRLGLEQWEDSELTAFREQWLLICRYPVEYVKGSKTHTYCALERTTIYYWVGMPGGAIVHRYKHALDDGTLQISHVDWRRGMLDFDIIYLDKSKINVIMNMKYLGSNIYLNSFKAVSTKRLLLPEDSIITIEYKIPEYTYMLDVKFEIRGMKTAKQKTHDEFINSLSEQDRLVYENESREGILFPDIPEKELEQKLKEKFSYAELENLDKKSDEDWTPDEKEGMGSILKELTTHMVEKGLARSRLSNDGKEKWRNYRIKEFERLGESSRETVK
jgi:hypothetical protein